MGGGARATTPWQAAAAAAALLLWSVAPQCGPSVHCKPGPDRPPRVTEALTSPHATAPHAALQSTGRLR